jgi:hypothetical protein
MQRSAQSGEDSRVCCGSAETDGWFSYTWPRAHRLGTTTSAGESSNWQIDPVRVREASPQRGPAPLTVGFTTATLPRRNVVVGMYGCCIAIMSARGTDFQLLHCAKSRRDPGTADMTDGLSGLNSGAHDPSLT